MDENPGEAPLVGSVCSGIGGMDYGLHLAGWRHAFFAESEPYRRDILRARFPGVPIYDDIRAVGVEPAPRAQDEQGRAGSGAALGLHASAVLGLVAGGTPCQDLSVAGQRRGLAGDRSGLFFEYARVVEALRPRWLLWENVPGAFSSNGGRDFGCVLGTLADIGYGLGWRLLDSRYFGVPQRRRRVFVVGARADGDPRAAAERAGQVLSVGSRCPRHPATRGEAGADVAVASLSGLGSGGPDDNDGLAGRLVAPPLTSKMAKGTGGPSGDETQNLVAHALTGEGHDASEDGTGRGTPLVTAFSHTQGLDAQPSAHAWPTLRSEGGGHAVGVAAQVRRLTPEECEALQALPRGWTNLGGTPDSERYAALGDAVTATVAQWIGARIIAADG